MNNSVILMQEEKDLIREILKEMTRRDKIYFNAILDSLITKGTNILKEEASRVGQHIDTPEHNSLVAQIVRVNIITVWTICKLEQKDGHKTLDLDRVNILAIGALGTLEQNTPDPDRETTSKPNRYSDFLDKSYGNIADYIDANREEVYKPTVEPHDLIPLYYNADIEVLPTHELTVWKYEEIATMVKFNPEIEKLTEAQAVLSTQKPKHK